MATSRFKCAAAPCRFCTAASSLVSRLCVLFIVLLLCGCVQRKAATGFANGCLGLYVTSAGVTRTCADPAAVRQRWVAAASRVRSAVRALLAVGGYDDDDGGAGDGDNNNNNGENGDAVSNNDGEDDDGSGDEDGDDGDLVGDGGAIGANGSEGWDSGVNGRRNRRATAKALRFHVAVFVAATEDAQNLASAPLAHAMAAFGETVQRWAVEDDCQAVGDPALLLWARAAVVMPFRARGRAGEEDGSRSINGSAPADGSAAEAAAGTAAAEDSEVFLTEESVLGDDETDRSFPAALGVTAHATSTLRRLLRRVKRGGKPFTVCRPGYGRLCF